jgi:glycosyltransferase involved in cell wall biosynthesis
MAEPIALLLVPRRVEGFILHDQGQDLLRSPGVVAVEAPRVPHGAVGRLPGPAAGAVAAAQARRLHVPGEPAAALMFHPFQLPFAEAVLQRWPGCELWYGLFDHTPAAPDAGPRTRRRLARLHDAAAERASFVFAVSPALVELEERAGREATLVPSAADSFPALDATDSVVAVSLGNLGRRTDWRLLRELGQRLPELTLLLIGAVAEDECSGDPDYRACRELPGLVWLGRRSDGEAARLMALADVGVAPFVRDEFNAAGLPNRILKAARLGLRTVTWDFPGLKVWSEAVVACEDTDAWVEALRSGRGRRSQVDGELREWALAQTARRQNAPLWERLRGLGVAAPAR